MTLSERDLELCESSRWDFSDLRAVYIDCTLKRSPEQSNTQDLMDRSIAVMEANNVAVKTFRLVDHRVATGVWPDMTEHWWERDEWPGPKTTSPTGTPRSCPWNLLHLSRMIGDRGGIPAHGNQRTAWDAWGRSDYPNPEHR